MTTHYHVTRSRDSAVWQFVSPRELAVVATRAEADVEAARDWDALTPSPGPASNWIGAPRVSSCPDSECRPHRVYDLLKRHGRA